MYGTKLKDLRLNANLLQKDIAKILEITEITYTHYENEYYIMPLKYLIKICDYFDISLDYIFSFTTKKKYKDLAKTDFNNLNFQLKNWRKENKITQDDLAVILNTNRSVIANYERGRTLISTPFLYTICKAYNVSADYLLGKHATQKME